MVYAVKNKQRPGILFGASTDANIPLSMGIPAVSIGAGGQGGGAHTPGEWFHPEGRETGLARIYLTLCLLLRGLETAAAG